ncbi:MAG TPA: hypothetical protein VK638_38790 [Edaphobacter sp.]|nr:hypothetical protein [Edaphobacter sp.]
MTGITEPEHFERPRVVRMVTLQLFRLPASFAVFRPYEESTPQSIRYRPVSRLLIFVPLNPCSLCPCLRCTAFLSFGVTPVGFEPMRQPSTIPVAFANLVNSVLTCFFTSFEMTRLALPEIPILHGRMGIELGKRLLYLA